MCAQRLHFQRCNLAETGFNAYWAAACVADAFTDEALTEFGGFDFDTRTEENGYRQLGRLEQFMAGRRRRANLRKHDVEGTANRERVKAFIGAYGVKTGKIASDDDFWAVAEVLWPGRIVKPTVPKMADLVSQITAISKADRKVARENSRRLPAHIRSNEVTG
jgi:hypothetical protein